MDDILKSAWGDLLNENEKLAALLDEKDNEIERLRTLLATSESLKHGYFARIERLEAAFEQCARIAENFKPDLDDPRKNQDQLAALIREAALAGKEGT